jgi:hypothetical protein
MIYYYIEDREKWKFIVDFVLFRKGVISSQVSTACQANIAGSRVEINTASLRQR